MTKAKQFGVNAPRIPLKITAGLSILLLAVLIAQVILHLTLEEPKIPEGLEDLCTMECLNASYTHGRVVVEDYNDTSIHLSCNCYNKYNELLWEVTNEVEIKH